MSQCKAKRYDGYICGSYAFNLHKEGINQDELCDVCYWRLQAITPPAREKMLDEAVERFLGAQ